MSTPTCPLSRPVQIGNGSQQNLGILVIKLCPWLRLVRSCLVFMMTSSIMIEFEPVDEI